MLKISKLSDYATLIMLTLSKQNTIDVKALSASAIAKQTHLGTSTVSKLLKMLNQAQLILAKRGSKGGYQLALPAEQISLEHIITAIEGRPALTECSQANGHCHHLGTCALSSNWRHINNTLLIALSNISLAAMAKPLDNHPLVKDGIPLNFHPLKSTKLTTTAARGKETFL